MHRDDEVDDHLRKFEIDPGYYLTKEEAPSQETVAGAPEEAPSQATVAGAPALRSESSTAGARQGTSFGGATDLGSVHTPIFLMSINETVSHLKCFREIMAERRGRMFHSLDLELDFVFSLLWYENETRKLTGDDRVVASAQETWATLTEDLIIRSDKMG